MRRVSSAPILTSREKYILYHFLLVIQMSSSEGRTEGSKSERKGQNLQEGRKEGVLHATVTPIRNAGFGVPHGATRYELRKARADRQKADSSKPSEVS